VVRAPVPLFAAGAALLALLTMLASGIAGGAGGVSGAGGTGGGAANQQPTPAAPGGSGDQLPGTGVPPRAALPAAGGAAPGPGGGSQRLPGTPYSRAIEVPAAGWVRVPLDLAALRHVGLRNSLRITSPGGEEVTHWMAPFIPESDRRPVKLVETRRDEHGWTLRFDAGPEPLLHERLLLGFAGLEGTPAVTLEGSRDGKAWETLVAGDLYRLGQGDDEVRTSLAYPATAARYLRLAWPAAAGAPELRSAVVEPTTPGRSLTITSPNNPCQSGPSPAALACRLPLPAAGLTVRRLTVELAAAGAATGYRLYLPHQGTWQPLTEGVWRGPAAARHVLQLPGRPLAAASLRLELFGTASEPAPRLLNHSFDLAVDTVLFYAEAPGRYTLSYGGAPASADAGGGGGSSASGSAAGGGAASAAGAGEQRDAQSVAAGVEATWVAPGPEDEGKPAPLPAAAPGAPLAAGQRFRAVWPVAASGAVAGDLVRLALPDAVYAPARPDLGDLRLAVGRRQIPYVRWTPAEPVAATARADLHPEAEKGRRYSHVEASFANSGLPVTQLDLTAPPAAMRRPVGVRYPTPGPAGLAPREEHLVARGAWDCLPQPPLPCSLLLPLPAPAAHRIGVRFADGDNPPLASVDLTVWRRGDVLIFVWPGKGVQLLAGSPQLTAPAYDLAELAEVLPTRPYLPATLDLTLTAGLRQDSPPWWSRWLLPVTLAGAVLLLVALLRRTVAET
jgi:hypothetical protein